MRFEEGRVVADHAVRRTVTLVETVTGKFFQQIEDGVRLFLRNLVCASTALDEIPAFFRHLLLVFLAHCAPEKIGLGERVTSELARSSHDLFLVNHHAVGVGTNIFQQWMQIFDRGDALLRFHVFGDQLHRAGSVQRNQGDDVVELLHVELFRKTGHAAGFHLEEPDRFSAVVERERSSIVQRNILQRKVWLPFANQRERIFDHG